MGLSKEPVPLGGVTGHGIPVLNTWDRLFNTFIL